MFFNECSQIAYASILVARSRLAQKCPEIRNRAYYDLNPVGKGYWTYKLFVEKKNPASPLESIADPEQYQFAYMNPEDNADNIDAEFLNELRNYPERQRRRFYDGVYVDQDENALWSLEAFEKNYIKLADMPALQRIVIAVDPSGASGPTDLKADEIGIVIVGRGVNGHYYVLEDNTGLYSPEQWGKIVREKYHIYQADRVIGEKNFGGDMVRAVIQQGDANVSYKDVVASRGKVLRAEPVSALYERSLVHHVGRLPKLEDELCSFSTAGYLGIGSPNRADALVHGLTELCGGGGGGWLDFYRAETGLADGDPDPVVITPNMPAYGALVPQGVNSQRVNSASQQVWDGLLGRL
jgi:phage terminase large subunit-like protein